MITPYDRRFRPLVRDVISICFVLLVILVIAGIFSGCRAMPSIYPVLASLNNTQGDHQ